MEYGLIGRVLGHSYSKEIHEQIADYQYELKELEPSELDGFLSKRDFKAINVTIPYKQDVIPFLDFVDERAEKIGVVNTIVNRDGKLYGYNTDFDGMLALIRKIGIEAKGKKALILGTGGTAKTAHAVLEFLGAAEILHVSRKLSDVKINWMEEKGLTVPVTYQEAVSLHSDAEVIINTTPSGMYPEVTQKPIDLSRFPELEGVLDVIYNPLRTNLILDAEELDIPAEGGLYMLAAQAVYACGHFLNREISTEEIDKAYQSVLDQKRNIVLCGMPSCGKTTIGNLLQERLQMPLIDTDAKIVERIGMEIAEYAALCGETAFRDVESSIVQEAASEGGSIIATGGGVVLREENVRALKRNGVLVFIDRPLDLLQATADRPFSADPEALKKRYEERYDIYCYTADYRVDGSGSAEEVAGQILRMLNIETN